MDSNITGSGMAKPLGSDENGQVEWNGTGVTASLTHDYRRAGMSGRQAGDH
jgi:hypothetical protein